MEAGGALASHGAPYRNRTGVSALRGPRPRPLDEGSLRVGNTLTGDTAQACRRFGGGVLRAAFESVTALGTSRGRRRAPVIGRHVSSPLNHASRGPPPPLRGGGCAGA